VIADDAELRATLDRIAWFQQQVIRLRATEPNPINYHAATDGFLTEIACSGPCASSSARTRPSWPAPHRHRPSDAVGRRNANMTRPQQFRAALAALVLALAAGAGCDRGPRNFAVVTPEVLYRSGQLDRRTFERVITEHQIKTVVSLRPDRGDAENSDAHEEETCRARGVTFVRIPPRTEDAGGDPLGPVVRAFLAVTDDPANHPILVHCTAGRDRTGTVCAVYRIERDGWPPAQALDEMRRFGFEPDKDAAAGAYANYVLNYRRRDDRSR
jgi:tyrosine-protein phosphatase SIW14